MLRGYHPNRCICDNKDFIQVCLFARLFNWSFLRKHTWLYSSSVFSSLVLWYALITVSCHSGACKCGPKTQAKGIVVTSEVIPNYYGKMLRAVYSILNGIYVCSISDLIDYAKLNVNNYHYR